MDGGTYDWEDGLLAELHQVGEALIPHRVHAYPISYGLEHASFLRFTNAALQLELEVLSFWLGEED